MITIKVGDKPLLARLEEVAARTDDTIPLMREIGGIMHGEVEANFEAEGRPKWRDLYPATKKARARKGHWPGKILQVTGGLANSPVARSTEDKAQVTTNKEYAAAQHFGATIIQAPRSSLFAQERRVKDTVRGKKGTWRKKKTKVGPGGAGSITSGTRVIDIAARPFMMLPDSGVQKVVRAVKNFLSGSLS